MTERLLAMLMMAEADSVAKRHQAEKRRSEAFQCYSTHPMSIGGYTERRAKVACSACDRLMSPNNKVGRIDDRDSLGKVQREKGATREKACDCAHPDRTR